MLSSSFAVFRSLQSNVIGLGFRLEVEPLPPSSARGGKGVGPEILLRVSHEFGKSMEWLLTGQELDHG